MPETPTVHTTYGELRGAVEGGAVRFRCVPFAAPPVGDLRFAAPAPPVPWSGVRDVSEPGPIAPQPPSRLALAMGNFAREQSEDCLTLAIATPALDGARRPVIVWLHGGAFLSGAGSLDWYDGGPLAVAGEVVVVGVNYRLGPLGFLHYPGLADGRMGMHDIVAALRYVRDEIAAFGGDPDNVTLMGQSAGSIAIMRLLTMEASAGLFHRAIAQSGPPRTGVAPDEATRRARRLMEFLDIDPEAADAAERLRAAPLDRMIQSQMLVARELARFAEIEPAFTPVFDSAGADAFADQVTTAAITRGVDLMFGTTREEMHAFLVADPAMVTPDPEKLKARFAELTGSAAGTEAYLTRRPGGSMRDALADLMTDHRFSFPTLRIAERMAEAGHPAFLYRFDYAPAGSPWRACHCIELPFVFGTRSSWADAPMLAGMDEAIYAGLSASMMAMWAAFARCGDPSVPALAWPAYTPESRWTMRFGDMVEVVGDLAGARRRP